MREFLHEAKRELEGVFHTVFVSLKYTRTVDVIRIAIDEIISLFDYLIDVVLVYCIEEKKIEAMPTSVKAKMNMLKKIYPDDEKLAYYLDFYIFLRDLFKAPFDKREEYRRHVTMIANLSNRTVEVHIDNLEDHFHRIAKDFFEYIKFLVGEEEEEIY